jgi:hypothetical protein
LYTHYTATGASGIDRIYATRNIISKKLGVETVAAAFTDHHAVILRIAISEPLTLRGRGYWRMNVTIMSDKNFQTIIQKQWAKFKTHKKYYPHSVMWWARYVKRMIRQLFINKGTECRRDRLAKETFYYDAMCNILQEATIQESTSRTLKELKARIVRLHHMERQRRLIDTEEQDRITEERPSLYHILKSRKRQEARIMHSIHDSDGNLQSNTFDLLRTFTEFMRWKYDHIQVDEDCIQRMENTLNKTLPNVANTALDAPVTMEEPHLAVRIGKPHKAPGGDGICQEFLKLTWETTKYDMLEILNQMHSNRTIMEQQKHGILVCLPKKPTP